ncbi:carbohydrate ABC transporter permease, partial [Mesorhizobium sp. M2D.F.Ca.ET.145.01.1.1]
MNAVAAQRWNFWGGIITALTLVWAILWAFPLYWGVISSLKPDDEVVRPYIELWPETPTLENYVSALATTQIGAWYVNSVAVA